jgi:hypothetical protein
VLEHSCCARRHALTGGREVRCIQTAVEQHRAAPMLELARRLTRRRLPDAKLPRGPTQAVRPLHRQEQRQLAKRRDSPTPPLPSHAPESADPSPSCARAVTRPSIPRFALLPRSTSVRAPSPTRPRFALLPRSTSFRALTELAPRDPWLTLIEASANGDTPPGSKRPGVAGLLQPRPPADASAGLKATHGALVKGDADLGERNPIGQQPGANSRFASSRFASSRAPVCSAGRRAVR